MIKHCIDGTRWETNRWHHYGSVIEGVCSWLIITSSASNDVSCRASILKHSLSIGPPTTAAHWYLHRQ